MTEARPASSARRLIRAASSLLGMAAWGCVEPTPPTAPSYSFIRVVVVASGGDLDSDGYEIVVDAVPKAVLQGVQEGSFYLTAGAHVVSIGKLAANCTVTGPNPRAVTLGLRETVTVQFDVICVPTGVMITTRATGVDIPQAFAVFLDDEPAGAAVPNESLSVGRLTPGDHTVTLKAPEHCTVSASGRMTVAVVAEQLTEVPFDITCTPVVRPERIAYVDLSMGWQAGQVALVNLDGGGMVQLGPGTSPAWSPDGKRLAFTNARCEPSYYYGYPPYCTGGLVILDPEIGDVTTPDWGQHVENPSWSPAGDAIVFDQSGSSGTGSALAIVQLAAPVIDPLPLASSGWKAQPAWSPDGKQIALTCMVTQPSTDICIVNRDGSALVQLTNETSFDAHAAWSPDGTKIAFARYPDGVSGNGDAEVVVMDIATRQLTTFAEGGEPAWSPDGSKLVFAGVDGLFIIDADGTNRRRLTTGAHGAPAWRP